MANGLPLRFVFLFFCYVFSFVVFFSLFCVFFFLFHFFNFFKIASIEDVNSMKANAHHAS